MDCPRYLVLLVLLFTGCTSREALKEAGRESPEQYGRLSRLKESHNAALREELERLEVEHALPTQMACELDPEQAALVRLVPAARLPRLLALAEGHLNRFLPPAEPGFREGMALYVPAGQGAEQDQSLNSFLREQATLRRDIAAKFAGEKLPAFQVPFGEGPLADLSFVGVCRLGNDLLALEAVQQLAANHPAEAAANVRTMLRISQALAATPHVTPRLAAVEMRGQALAILSHVALHPHTSPTSLEPVRQTLDEALAHWPDDALAWRGDRATTLVTYELVARGKLLSVLASDDVSWLRKHDQLATLVESVSANWEQDAAFYLAAQREILATCDQPYYLREEVFARLDAQLRQLETTVSFPRLAAELFLADVERGHRLLALDWARCEAWSLALTLAAGSAPAESISSPINPLTGQPFVIVRNAEQIAVHGVEHGERDEVAAIPLPPLAPVAERPLWKR